jgi:hypothetical protein
MHTSIYIVLTPRIRKNWLHFAIRYSLTEGACDAKCPDLSCKLFLRLQPLASATAVGPPALASFQRPVSTTAAQFGPQRSVPTIIAGVQPVRYRTTS